MTIATIFKQGINKLFFLGLVLVLGGCGGGGGGKSKSQASIGSVISSIAASSLASSNSSIIESTSSRAASTTVGSLASSDSIVVSTSSSSSSITASSLANSNSSVIASTSNSSSSVGLVAPSVTTTYGIKKLIFNWTPVNGAMFYKVLKSDGNSGYTLLAGNITATSYSDTVATHLNDWLNVSYIIAACDNHGCTNSPVLNGFDVKQMIGYFKASNTDAQDNFGVSVALSADGSTLAVGATSEASAAPGINGNQDDDSVRSGAVYVYTFTNNAWSQQAYIKASNPGNSYNFGVSVALSADGNTLAVGSYGEASNTTGINGDQTNNSMHNAGATYIYTRTGGTWSQEAYIKASNTTNEDYFAIAIALSADGNSLAVGARDEDSNATGIGGDQSNNSKSGAGAVYMFRRTGKAWSQESYIKASNSDANDGFGESVALSADGSTLAVGASGEASNATGIDSDQGNNSMPNSGAVYVFIHTGSTWLQQSYIKASKSGSNDRFGGSVALNSDGSTLAVGAYGESSNATGIGGAQGNNLAADAGAVYVFTRTGINWTQQAYIKSSSTSAGSSFGYPVALSADGNTLAVGAYLEDGNSTGINSDQTNTLAADAGAAYMFTRAGGAWLQKAYVKASNTDANDYFGVSVALNADGTILAVGAYGEASNALGVGADQNNNAADGSGAVYLY